MIKNMAKPVSVRIDVMVDIPVLNKPLSPSHIIQAEDITTMKVPIGNLHGHYALRTDDLLGKQSKHKLLMARAPLQINDLMAPIIIRRDGLVRVIYRSGNLSIATQAKALKDGAFGQRITLETTGKAKKIIEATVLDPHTVEMQVAS